VVGTVGDGLAGRLEGGRHIGQDLVEVDLPDFIDDVGDGDDIHWHGGFEFGAGGVAGADDGDHVDFDPFTESYIDGGAATDGDFCSPVARVGDQQCFGIGGNLEGVFAIEVRDGAHTGVFDGHGSSD